MVEESVKVDVRLFTPVSSVFSPPENKKKTVFLCVGLKKKLSYSEKCYGRGQLNTYIYIYMCVCV